MTDQKKSAIVNDHDMCQQKTSRQSAKHLADRSATMSCVMDNHAVAMLVQQNKMSKRQSSLGHF